MSHTKSLSQKLTGVATCLSFGVLFTLGGIAPAQADTSTSQLKNIDAYEQTVLLQNFTAEEILVLDSMVTEQEVDQLVALIEDPYSLQDEDSDEHGYLLAAEWRPNGCTASPDKIGKANFRPSCNKHDACYASFSRTNRYDCDRTFRSNLRAECKRVYSGVKLNVCNGIANTYYTAVRAAGWAFYKGKGVNN